MSQVMGRDEPAGEAPGIPPSGPVGDPAGRGPATPGWPDQGWRHQFLTLFSDDRVARMHQGLRVIGSTPFTRRTWSELLYLVVGFPLAALGLVYVGLTMAVGIVLAITFVGLAIIALSLRGARGLGGIQRGVARRLLGLAIADPEPFAARPGFLGWLQSALRDRTGWRAVAYVVVKVPLAVFGFLFAFSVWWDALACLATPLWAARSQGPPVWGPVRSFFGSGYFQNGGFFHGVGMFVVGAVLLFIAPWITRLTVFLDRLLMQGLLAPDAVTARLRTLEEARARTVDTSAATLRRIERDLHDGTQAQLVALAMRLGMAKEKLADDEHLDLNGVRQLIDDAHRGAKEVIVELRDLARGIHPPALDTGLEGALATLAARSTVPAELTVSLVDRPSPAIEAIAYFCVAELLANVAQHARASRAVVTCAQHGVWLRVVVRDDGVGGAHLSRVGSSSSGLAGLTDRVHTVDGRLHIVSPPGGPSVVSVDLPLHA
jgi:signal transduction histidine kinase